MPLSEMFQSLTFARQPVRQGNVTIKGRESPNALYSADLASMDIDDGGALFDYNPADSQGFIKINSTRLKAYFNMTSKLDATTGAAEDA